MRTITTTLAVVSCLFATGVAENTYMVVLPNTIRPDTTLSVSVTFLTPVQHQQVTARILAEEDGRNRTIAQDSRSENRATTITLYLQVPTKLDLYSYYFDIVGVGSVNFKNETRLWTRTKSFATFIQTDKALYKPGDTVKYRIFTVDGALDLVEPKLNVEFFDPKGNKIDERTGVISLTGIAGELALTDMPPLGRWRISVNAPDFSRSQTNYHFEVAEYVLPKFQVTVTLPPFGMVDDGHLKGTIKAMYTFGKPVDGFATLTFSKRYGSGFFNIRAVQKITEKLQNGEVAFQAPIELVGQLSRRLKYESIRVEANVTEDITGITEQGVGYIQYHESRYKIEFHPNQPDNFKPGFNPYRVVVRVTDQDGRPPAPTVPPRSIDITVSYFTQVPVSGRLLNQLLYNFDVLSPFVGGDVILMDTKSYPIQDDGKVEFGLDIPQDVATLSIKAEFAGQQVYKDVRRFRSPGETYLRVYLTSQGPLKVGDTARLSLTSTHGPVTVQYMITSKNLILTTGERAIHGPRNQATVDIPILRNMAPSARFVAYYIRPDGEIVVDGINFIIEDMFENKVTIEFDQTATVEPKTPVKLTVTADPNSVVNVLAVDKSVKLLREGNDITQDRVKQEIGSFGDYPYLPRGWGHFLPWPIPADDASDIFRVARLKVLTDATLYKFDLWRLNTPEMFRSMSGAAGLGFGGAVQMDAAPGAPSSAPQGQVREDFPETWIMESNIANAQGVAEFRSNAPDTITEWVATAFALNSQTGLGVAREPANLTTFLPFFVNAQLPYSVIRGELAVIQANVFSYHPEDLSVTVILKNTGEFVPVTIDNAGQEVDATGDQVKCVLVKSGKPTPVYFSVRPTIVSAMTVNIRITTLPRNIFDEIVRTLPVKAEGERKEMNFPVLITRQTSGVTTETVPIVYPPSTVPQSQIIRATVIGDIFGPSLVNLDSLILMPSGCGEQNMLNFAPAVFAAIYMKITGRYTLNVELQEKIKRVLQTGYRRELVFQRRDGSLSTFGEADEQGSLWLTAFVMKSFAQAHGLGLVFIDPQVLEKSVHYIFGYQTPDGFNNTGIVHHKAMQGASATNRRSLTAYVLIALQEVRKSQIISNADTLRMLDAAISMATTTLTSTQDLMTTDYEYAIGAYALKLLEIPAHAALLTKLENSPNRTNKIDGTSRYWKDPSHALEVEIASYALLTHSLLRNINDGFAIMSWLVRQRNPNGGFVSTQDTIVALQALSEFAAIVYSKEVSMTVDINTVTGNVPSPKQTIYLNTDNHDVLQYADFNGDGVNSVDIEGTGLGLAMVGVNVLYNVERETTPSYTLQLDTLEETEQKFLLRVCTSFAIPDKKSNMAILDVGAPSGFEQQLNLVEKTPLLKRKELVSGRLVLYFDEIPKMELCVSVPMQRVALVAGVKPATVLAYSYYEPRERIMKQYLPAVLQRSSGLCDICGAECGCSPNALSLPIASCV